MLFRSLLLLFLLHISSSYSKERTVGIWVNDSHPPYTYEVNGVAQGVYVEVLRRISSKMRGYKMKIIPAPWQRVKAKVKSGEAFGFAPPYYHGYDWDYVWPYSIPMMEEFVILMCRNKVMESSRKIWPDDFHGLVIGNNTGYDGFGGPKFRYLVEKGKIKLQEAKTTEQNIVMLIYGRSDCYMVNRLSFAWELQRMLKSKKIKQGQQYTIQEVLVLSSDPVYLALTDADNGQYHFKRDFLQEFNNQLYRMQKSKELDEIVKMFIGYLPVKH